MQKTGDICSKSGLYTSECCDFKVVVGRNAVFPECGACEKRASWRLSDFRENAAELTPALTYQRGD